VIAGLAVGERGHNEEGGEEIVGCGIFRDDRVRVHCVISEV
jgi:hypothetical protein